MNKSPASIQTKRNVIKVLEIRNHTCSHVKVLAYRNRSPKYVLPLFKQKELVWVPEGLKQRQLLQRAWLGALQDDILSNIVKFCR